MPTFDSGRVRPVRTALLVAVSALLPAIALRAQETRGLGARADTSAAAGLGAYHALLIAVEDYADPAVPRLDQPIRDAESLRNALVRRYRFDASTIEVLRNPTRDEILEKLFALSERLGRDDNLLIFFAGHGQWDEQSQQGYWLPADARRANNARWISNGSIVDALRRIRTRHTLLISDACFSGGIFVTRDASAEVGAGMARLYERPSRKAMTSGAREIVPDRSRFLEYLLARLEANQAALLPAAELFTSLRGAVMNNSPVTPQYGTIYDAGDEGGDFLFALRDSAVTLDAGRPEDADAREDAAARRDRDQVVTRPERPANAPIVADVDSARRALAARGIAWSAASLSSALAAADLEVLRLFSQGGAEPGMVLEALGSRAGSDRTTALAFFERARGNAGAVEWLSDAIKRGLDPNATVPGPYYPREGLLIAAVRAANAPAVLALLDGGASPHAYQELFLTPYPLDRFVMAFDAIVRNDTFTDTEKRAILERFLAAGGIVPGLDSIQPNATTQTVAIQRMLSESESLAGVALSPSPTLAARPRTRVCEVASERDGFDWCAFVAGLPRRVLAGSSVYVDFHALELVGLMNVVDGKAYFMSVERTTYRPGFGIVEISRDARSWRVYRFMSPAAGMGLCTEDDNGQRHDDCWRRISMRYDPARGIMRVEDYYDYRVER